MHAHDVRYLGGGVANEWTGFSTRYTGLVPHSIFIFGITFDETDVL